MPDFEKHNSFSEPVQEIMGAMPSWMTRWGATVIACILLAVIVGCCIIKYPQTVTSAITLTSENPPSDLAARYDGLLDSVLVSNGQEVRKGQLVALLSTPAEYGDITAVEKILDRHSGNAVSLAEDSLLMTGYRLGDLQSGWEELVRACSDYRNWYDTDQAGVRKRLASEQISRNVEYYKDLLAQREFIEKDMEYEQRTFARDSLLMLQGAISQAEFETSARP